MNRIGKKSKSGFTLLEVILAVVILVIASTMIMKGFIAVMIFGRNNRNYVRAGEYNYRRAMNESIIHNATSGNQQANVIVPLTGGVHSTLSASFDNSGYVPSSVDADDVTLVVDVSAYVDPDAPVFSESEGAYNMTGDTLDSSTSSTSRYAFFYDFGDYLGVPSDTVHIYRWGYMFVPKKDYNPAVHTGYVPIYGPAGPGSTPVGYGLYGYYCFNSECVNEDGTPSDCRCHPYVFPT